MAFYPEGIQAQSPGLRGTSYPGWAVLVVPTPTGLWRARRFVGHNPVGVEPISPPGFPRVARSSQPWAGGRNPWGLTIGGNQPPLADPNFPEAPLIAAIVRSRGYRIVTRDGTPFERMGCRVVNPWK